MGDSIAHVLLTPEQALAQLATIVEFSDDAIISKTLDGIILTWNSGAQRVYGYSAEEAIGRHMAMLLPTDRADEEAEILARIARGERVEHFEAVRRTKSGDLIDVSLTISPMVDRTGRVTGASHVARNITERKRIDARLQHLAAIIQSSDDAIISKTLDGIILTWNAAAERLYGYSASEAIDRHMTMLLPDNRPDEEANILARIARGERVEHFETVRRTKNGDLIDVSLTISPTVDQSGRVTGASHIARNITERKRIDEQLRHTQKLESLGVLAGGIAHDFNNLLTGILGNASLALDILPGSHPTTELLRDVLDASERAAMLTRQLLAYAGKGSFVIEPIDISELVRDISRLIQTSIPKNVQIRFELRDDLPLVLADAGQLQQLVMNLIINGAEAIRTDDTGTVMVTTALEHLGHHQRSGAIGDSPALAPGAYVSLEVRDTGIGMDKATLGRIFDPFYTTKFTGRGLGLSAVQGIVRGHKGTIDVVSRPGFGTTFKVLLPASDARVVETSTTSAPSSSAKELVLVVDDEEVIRRTAQSMLERNGYAVVVAEDGQRAVDLFRVLADKVALVLLDVTMPVMGGEEAFQRMKRMNPDVKVVLSSGYSEAEVVRPFMGQGLAGFLQKPYSATTLCERIGQILKKQP